MHTLSEVTFESVPRAPIRWHEYADLFPWLGDKDRADLRESIRKEGVVEPIVFLGRDILDGRNRYELARELLIEYPRVDYLGDDPLGFVIAKNLHRRHLSDQQRVMMAAKIAKLPRGRPETNPPSGGITTAQAAKMLDVPERTVQRAKAIERDGAAQLVEAVETGSISVASAAEIARLPVAEQIEVLQKADPKALNAVVKAVRAKKQAEKKAKRVDREKRLASKQTALPDRQYGVIVADPEWKFLVRSEETGMDRAAANHYPTSRLEEIMARDVPSIAAADCVLFMWATVPHLVEAICVLDAWGFALIDRDAATGHLIPEKSRCQYVSSWAWLKEKIITGYWTRGKHEILMIATKGSPVAPAMGDQLPSWLEAEAVVAPSSEHSAKPEIFLEWIEKMWPNTPKIELNRRGPARAGWAAWGNEADVPADDFGMVKVDASHVVHRDFLTDGERAQVLARGDLPPHDPETGEIIESEAGPT